MKIHTRELHPELELDVKGDEPWLARIYGDFPVPSGAEIPKITGQVQLRLEEAGTVVARGELSYAPFVHCSRCELPIPWPLALSLNVRYSPAFASETRDKTLSRAELDEYFLQDDQLDLEELINDTVQTSLPSRLSPLNEEGTACSICHQSVSGELVYGRPEETAKGKESPFARLLQDVQVPKAPKPPKDKH
jgi:uncharacterized metal-binding protein YceD (DUF177 family)